jgi:RNA polymerase sigma-70 factor, ECF subfamily
VLDAGQRETFEQELRLLWERGEHDTTTARILERYGPELFGYLVAVARSEADAADAFSLLSEDLWRGIGGFRWQASVRTWAYVLARNALRRTLRAPHRRAGWVPLSDAPEIYELAERVRTGTLEYLRTDVKDQFAELRRTLDPQDQDLLILRVGRQMSWNEIAQILCAADRPDDEALAREAARLRKRFERAKRALSELAKERGLTGA